MLISNGRRTTNMPNYKNPLELSDEILRDARRKTLNKRINYKGNYENYITGGSHALDNQVFYDSNDYVKGMVAPGNGWDRPETQELFDRYTNPQHNKIAGDAPYDSSKKYIHRYTPSTRRGRRASDIWFKAGTNGAPERKETLEQIQNIIDKYEGWK